MNKLSKIFVAGHSGMVGSAIVRLLKRNGYQNIITQSSSELDLRNQNSVAEFFRKYKPEFVYLAAAKVGGILANSTYKAEFIYDNLMIESNVIHYSYLSGVRKLLFLGSSCIYPKMSNQPIHEEYLLSGYLEPTNQSYAIAKIAGIELCESYRFQYGCNFISVMPTNLYGPNDNYDLQNSHVIAAMFRKFIIAKQNNLPYVELWGTGSPMREFLHVDDLADACYFLMKNFDCSGPLNIGSGKEVSISELAGIIKTITRFEGDIIWDGTKPDGTPRKLLDVSKINSMGWIAKIELKVGLAAVYSDIKNIF